MFGESALFDGGARSATAFARERSTLLGIERDRFDTFLDSGSASAFKMFDVAVRNLGRALYGANMRFKRAGSLAHLAAPRVDLPRNTR
jgi:CRP-like cAMP-binding protein